MKKLDANMPAGVFFGKTVSRREVAGFRLSETWYTPSLEIPKHSHACANFCFVLRGNYAEVYEGRSRNCSPATLIFHPLGEVHSDQHAPVDVSIFCVEIEAPRLEAVQSHSVVLDAPADFQGGLAAHLGARLYTEFRRRDDVAPLAIEGLMLEVMAETSRRTVSTAERHPPRWLGRARDLLQSQYAVSLTLTDIAQAVGVHSVHLAREFRRHYHCTVADYVRDLRVEAACRRLTGTQEALGEIALSVGFADQSHFTRVFKGSIGMTPSEYRRICNSR